MNIGEHIKQLRKSKGLTQNKLAELLNISTMTVRRWEWGERKPDITVMPKLANTLNTSINELMDLQDSVEKNSTAEGIL
ncbi:MAG: helix-turn-helix transcriptional regulator, partial [Synergistaceae bacterium]|nr:helix-turn-helix transcriptional regulator [Synergistaceae bacterium]